ncbi:MAG: ABC transporter substrate-binding protein [Lawsonibacter sp.]|jgi:peptide/nickel transport system substrate-binding protein
MKKKLLSLALCLSMTMALLASCGGNNNSSSASNSGGSTGGQQGDVLYHVYHSSPYVTLDPSTEYSNGILVLQNVYETLTYYNSETGELEPLLATEWSSNEDGTVWTFQLRDDVTFHDGTAMTSADVKASLERTISLGQGAAYNWDAVESIETNGDYEVIITCSSSTPVDLIASAGYAGYIMSAEAVQQDTEWFNAGNDGGTGPYTIAQAEASDTVVLQAYENYRGGWTDNQYKTVLIKQVLESSARRQMLETGEAQLSEGFSSTDLEALKAKTDTLYSYQADTWNNAIAFLNTQKAPCDNVDFRKALQYSFPYQETVDGVMAGNAVQSIGLVPNGMWAHDPDLFQYTTDLEKAKEYLAASGVDTSNLTLSATYSSGYDEYSSILQLWQANLRELGISLEIRGMEWDAQWAEAQAADPNNRQDILLMRWWPDYTSPSSWFDSLVRSEETITFNLAYINDPELDELIAQADAAVATDRELAESLYIQVQEKLIESAPMVNMFDDSHTYIISNTITGVAENPAYSNVIHYYNVTKNN